MSDSVLFIDKKLITQYSDIFYDLTTVQGFKILYIYMYSTNWIFVLIYIFQNKLFYILSLKCAVVIIMHVN